MTDTSAASESSLNITYVPAGTFSGWQAQYDLLNRMVDASTPPRERADHWWREVAALASRRCGPGHWSAYLRRDGYLDRESPMGTQSQRIKRLFMSIQQLAIALVDADLAAHVQSLPYADIGGRLHVIPLLRHAIEITVNVPNEFYRDTRLRDQIVEVLASSAAQRTLSEDDLRLAVLTASQPIATSPKTANKECLQRGVALHIEKSDVTAPCLNKENEIPVPNAPINAEELLLKIVAATGGDTSIRMLAIGQDESKTVDQRQREIFALDNGAVGWTGKRWADLMKVSEQAARQTPWWNNDRKRLRAD